MSNEFLTPAMLALVPVVMALVQLLKMYVGSKWAPLMSLVVGIIVAFFVPALTTGMTILGGIVLGLISAGVYSGVKATVA